MSKRGPDRLPVKLKRRHQFGVYFNDAELADLLYIVSPDYVLPDDFNGKLKLELGVRRKVGRYLRNAALNRLPVVVPEINREAWLELSKAAANLNQIAHHLNTGGDPDFAAASAALADFRCRLIGANGGLNDEGGDDEI